MWSVTELFDKTQFFLEELSLSGTVALAVKNLKNKFLHGITFKLVWCFHMQPGSYKM